MFFSFWPLCTGTHVVFREGQTPGFGLIEQTACSRTQKDQAALLELDSCSKRTKMLVCKARRKKQ